MLGRKSVFLPEQLAAVGVVFVVDGFLQNAAEVERQPAESKDQHEAEHRLRHFPPLHQIYTEERKHRASAENVFTSRESPEGLQFFNNTDSSKAKADSWSEQVKNVISVDANGILWKCKHI